MPRDAWNFPDIIPTSKAEPKRAVELWRLSNLSMGEVSKLDITDSYSLQIL